MNWKNLAPDLIRQRLVIECTTEKIVEPEKIKEYLEKLAEMSDMEKVSGPFAYSAHEMGYGGWVHWKKSGSHVYSYPTSPPLLTVDTYTCQRVSIKKVVDFTKEFFNAIEIVWKEINV